MERQLSDEVKSILKSRLDTVDETNHETENKS